MSGLDKRPRIKWECLKDEEKKREYKRRTNELIQEERKEDMNVEWTKLTKVMMQAAEEVCGVIENGVANPWTFGSEEEIRRKEMIEEMIKKMIKKIEEGRRKIIIKKIKKIEDKRGYKIEKIYKLAPL